ncbi:MAG: sulfotransferase family protein [Actinomycetes bacterium]
MAEEPPEGLNDRPIFVVGCPRSGTTLLQVMLHAHPRIAIPPETRFVVHAYRERQRFGDLTVESNRRELARWLTERREGKFRVLKLDADEVADQIMAGPPTLGSAVGIVLRAYANRFGKPRWGDKRPGYWQDVDVLLRLFPDAQIVHIVRDGRACVASLKRMAWWNTGVDGGVATWLMAQERVRKDTRHLSEGSYHELHYEHLVNDPEAELRRLCGFLGERFDEEMLKTTDVARYAVPKKKTRAHHVRLTGAVDTAAVESWREGLEPHEIGLMEWVAGRRLRSCGYPLSGAGTRPTPAQLLSFSREYGRRQMALHRRRLGDARLRRREDASVAAQLTAGQRGAAGQPG